ncbi:MAG: hypothetical protein ACRC57_05170 [Sarcina sp.]
MSKPSGVLGNSIDIHVGKNDQSAEIRADVKVDEFESKRIWGQVINCSNQPIANSLVKLIKVICKGNKKYYEGVAHTITDCEGFYQFDVCDNNENECYKIIITKATTGQELVIDTQGGNCGACNIGNGCGQNTGGSYNPCQPYNPIIKEYNPHECQCSKENDCNCNHQQPINPCQMANQYGNNNCECDETYASSCNNKGKKINYATYTR